MITADAQQKLHDGANGHALGGQISKASKGKNIVASKPVTPLSAQEKKKMLCRYMEDIIKGCTTVPHNISPLYRIISASSPASGKTTLLDFLKHIDQDMVAIDRDRLALYHPNLHKIMKDKPMTWAKEIRETENVDDIIDNNLLNRLMAHRYNIANTENNLLEHLDKADQFGYKPRIILLKVPRHVAKMRVLRRFLFPEGDIEKRRLVSPKRFEVSPNSFEAKFDKKVKKLYEYRPNTPILTLYQTEDQSVYKHDIVKSYEEYQKLHEKINKPPTTRKEIMEHNDICEKLEKELQRQFPKDKNPQIWSQVQGILKRIPLIENDASKE